MTGRPDVILYSRRTCGLCDEARDVVETVRRSVAFSFSEIHIDGDDELEREYGIRVPVVMVDGVEAFEISVSARRLRDLVSG